MTDNISVTHYPTEDGKLYRSDEGIIYAIFDNEITAIGCDIKQTGSIFPINLPALKSLVHQEASIDDSLAKYHAHEGGLKANKLIVGNLSIHLQLQPFSLVNIVLDYISKNHQEGGFNLELLPKKLKKSINFLSKLNEKRDELGKTKLQNRKLITELKYLHIDKIAEKKRLHLQEISQMENDHFKEIKRLGKVANREEAEMMFLITLLENLVTESL
uniref:Uncharacterized protein n=1 Tax=Pithovirus LCPAC202 TaxID=2506592 RepID=A0A481Z6S9_9VIRU|nr:MAG: hypothetical protein LCPAC202_02290 [Pithovirus LCPAC202]